ncbi:hypothetical protein ACIG6B_28665 [Bacillus mobilis]|uniref:hypothetical protein n=1 Tax=Bacillus mobilis TaxID=2026190 RepID=UPI00363FF69C
MRCDHCGLQNDKVYNQLLTGVLNALQEIKKEIQRLDVENSVTFKKMYKDRFDGKIYAIVHYMDTTKTLYNAKFDTSNEFFFENFKHSHIDYQNLDGYIKLLKNVIR